MFFGNTTLKVLRLMCEVIGDWIRVGILPRDKSLSMLHITTTTLAKNRTHHARRTAHAPRPMSVWLQVGAVLLLLWNGLQAIIHHNGTSTIAAADQATPSTPQERMAYYYQPDNLRASENMQPSFQYAGYYAHAPGTMSVTPIHAQDAKLGRWVERDPLPAK